MMQQQKKQNKKNNNKDNNARKNKEEEEETPSNSTTTVLLKVDMPLHNGCTSKILRYLRGAQGMKLNVAVGGVKDNYVKAESEAGKLPITGKMDPSKLKKKIDLISSALHNKDKKNNKPDNKKPKEPTVTTVVLKVELHCHGCMERIRNTVSKTKGVQEVAIDREKETVTVKGTMEAKALVGKLMRRLRRTVEVVPSNKKDTKEVDKEKVKKTAPDRGGCSGGATTAKKKKDGSGKGDRGGEGGSDDSEKMKQSSGLEFPPPTLIPYGYGFNYEPLYMSQVYAPQIFSDENPNACIVM